MMPARKNNWLPSIFNDFFGNEWVERQSVSSPAVNIIENDKEYKVEIAAPGLTKDDFKIDVHDDNHLMVSMEKSTENKEEDKDKKYLRREFSYTSFRQTMILPDNVDKDKIKAEVKDGVLNIDIPKVEKKEKPAKKKQIEVK